MHEYIIYLLYKDNTPELLDMAMLMLIVLQLFKLLPLLRFTQIIVQVKLLKDERVFIGVKRRCSGTAPAWVQIR